MRWEGDLGEGRLVETFGRYNRIMMEMEVDRAYIQSEVSVGEVGSAEWADLVPLHPFLDALAMEYVRTIQFLNDLFLFEAFHADGTGFLAPFHDHRLNFQCFMECGGGVFDGARHTIENIYKLKNIHILIVMLLLYSGHLSYQ